MHLFKRTRIQLHKTRVLLASLALMVAVLLPSCRDRKPTETATMTGVKAVNFVEDEELQGLRMILREAGPPVAGAGEQLLPADAEILSAARAEELLGRVPAMEIDAEDKQAFAKRAGSKPPPLTGDTIDIPFPPPAAPPVPEGEVGVLEVLRYAPVGDVPMAPHLSVTFNKPMVSVTSQEEAADSVPVTLTPTPEGNWRWLGTKTLMFDPDPRFPMATEYRITVPAGTTSANGDKLAKEVGFSFLTPAPGLINQQPWDGPIGLEPVIYLGFDQTIDAAAMTPFIKVKAGSKSFPLRPATDEEIAADSIVRSMVDSAQEGRWLAFKPKTPLPAATSFQVVVAKGAPSAEGPRTTPGEQAYSFYTFDPLKIEQHRCGWYEDECPPTADWMIELNNPLDIPALDPAAFTVTPAVNGLRVTAWDDTLTISGLKQGRTTYKVTVPASLTDTFGQTLGKDQTVSFKVGPAQQTLFGPGKELVSLDPAGPAKFPVYTTNHDKLKVRIHKVTPQLWDDWMTWQRTYHYDDKNPGPLPGDKVFGDTIKVDGEDDRLTETMLDLEPYLDGDYGQFLVWIEPTKQLKERWYRQEVYAWVQVTDLGLAAFVDNEELLGWVTEMGDGKAAPGAQVSILPDGQPSGTSDQHGLVRLALPDTAEGPSVLLATRGQDHAILPQNQSYWNDNATWLHVERSDQMRWFTFDDRGMYKPGEQVRVKGWIRTFESGKGGDIQAFPGESEITWTLRGPRGNDLSDGQATLSALGGFDLTLELPKDVNLGTAWLTIHAGSDHGLSNRDHSHAIQIQEFRRPEFEVSATAEAGPFVLGEEAIVSVEAAYYAGGGLPNAEVNWSVSASPGYYTPPNQSEYSFGVWSPWWRYSYGDSASSWESLSGKTDPLGQHHLGIHFESMNPPRPMTVSAEASVMDVNRQAWAASSSLLVHPASLYVGLKTEASFVGKGEKIELDVIVTDIDGNPVEDVETTVRMTRMEWGYNGSIWAEQEVDPKDCDLTSGAKGDPCTFKPKEGGSYKLLATIRDDQGRKNQSELRVWVSGGEKPPSRTVEQEQLQLIPEKQEYQPGETATVLLQAPFYPAEGLLSIRRDGLVRTEPFTLDGPSTTLQVPVLEEHIPDFTVQVDITGSAPRLDDKGEPQDKLPRRVAFASGSLTFKVPPLLRTLAVTATPQAPALEPGGQTTLDVMVLDAAGKGVAGAEVAVWVVDESVLALTGYKTPDPLTVFYASRGTGVADYHQRHQVVLGNPESVAEQAANNMAANGDMVAQSAMPPAPPGGSAGFAEGGAMDDFASAEPMEEAEYKESDKSVSRVMKKKGNKDSNGESAAQESIAVRSDFNAMALFAAEVGTDAAGHAAVPITVPDNLTRYRVMAVAVAGGQQFGAGESTLTARLPLMVRPSPPRFLNFGDRFELPVVLQNQTDKAMTVEVAVRGSNVSLADTLELAIPGNAEELVAVAGRKVSVPANDRVEVRFPAAAQMAGTARFQVVAATKKVADASSFDLPIWTPATSEAFATYGELDDGVMVQPVRAPGDVWPQFGGLEITTSSTQLQALTDAVVYLVSYPYDCNEQIASRVLAIAALRDVLDAFESDQLPPPEELQAAVDRDMAKLAVRQNWNGGFAFWRKGDQDWPYLTIHVAHSMARAKDKGYEVPPQMWNNVLPYLNDIRSHIPGWYSQESKWTIRAYALYVRHRMGHNDVKKAKKLLKEAGVEKLPLEAQGWLLPVLHAGGASDQVAQIEQYVNNHVTETAAGAHFVTNYSDGAHVLLHSDRRVDGVLLESLIEVDPDSDLIPKVVRGLLGHRVRGRWGNTQENAFVLLALDRYFAVYEKETPDFVARAWLGDTFAGEHEFKGRTTERAHIDIPMGYLTEVEGDQPLTLQKDGVGRMYYRVGMNYAPRDLELEPADYGFAVERVYEAVDDEGDVTQDDDGVWHIKAGARVRVRLTMVAPMRRYHVALVDPLPAGLEPVNPELAVSGTIPPDMGEPDRNGGGYWWWWREWYEHENMRDERVEAFTSLLWDGVHKYTYVARATTPGEFVVPPTKAEEMYHPETFGRGGTDFVIVE